MVETKVQEPQLPKSIFKTSGLLCTMDAQLSELHFKDRAGTDQRWPPWPAEESKRKGPFSKEEASQDVL